MKYVIAFENVMMRAVFFTKKAMFCQIFGFQSQNFGCEV